MNYILSVSTVINITQEFVWSAISHEGKVYQNCLSAQLISLKGFHVNNWYVITTHISVSYIFLRTIWNHCFVDQKLIQWSHISIEEFRKRKQDLKIRWFNYSIMRIEGNVAGKFSITKVIQRKWCCFHTKDGHIQFLLHIGHWKHIGGTGHGAKLLKFPEPRRDQPKGKCQTKEVVPWLFRGNSKILRRQTSGWLWRQTFLMRTFSWVTVWQGL